MIGGPPSPNGANGRDGRGRFGKGNKGGPGNPYARQVGKLRSALLKVLTPRIVEEVTLALVEEAKGGNVAAMKEVLDRGLGKPVEADLIERLEALEARQAEGNTHELPPAVDEPGEGNANAA